MLFTGLFILPISLGNKDVDEKFQWFYPILIFVILATFLILFFSLASFTDPGYVYRDGQIDF